MGGGGGGVGVNPEQEFVNADQTISTTAFDAIVSTETVLNSVIHKQTLPSSPKVLVDFDARVLLEVNGLSPSFDPEIKRQISDKLNNFFLPVGTPAIAVQNVIFKF